MAENQHKLRKSQITCKDSIASNSHPKISDYYAILSILMITITEKAIEYHFNQLVHVQEEIEELILWFALFDW